MAFELVYTSAPAGIEPGSSGFCTVAATRGIPRSLIRLLESLTAYNPIFAHYTQEAAKNPVANLHCVIDSYHIFARLHGAGLDYTGRSNKFADFLIFSDAELRRTNTTPADVFKLAPSPFRESWSGPPDPDLPEPVLPDCPHRDDPAYIWQQCCGDAACAAILASYARTNPGTPLHILFDPLRLPTPDCTGKLAAEAIALLEPENARRVTFHSCFTQNAPPGILIQWRFIPLQSEMASKVRNNPRLTVFDLAQMPTLLQSSDHHFTRLAERARSGRIDMPVPPRPPAPPVQNVVSTAPGGHAAEFEYDREAPLFKFQPKRPKPPETCEEDGAAATPKRGHQIFFILGLIVLIAVVMGGVVLFNTPFKDLQKIWDPWKRLDSSAAITSDLDVTEDHVDEPASDTPPPEDTEPGEGVSLSRPEEAKEPAAQFPERDKAEPRNLTAEIPSAVPGAAIRKAGAVPEETREEVNDEKKLSYSQLQEKLNSFSTALEGKDGMEKLTVLNEAIAFAAQPQFEGIWAPEEAALLRKWETEYADLRDSSLREIARRLPQTFKDVAEAQQAQQTLQELQEFDRKFPPQTGTAGVEQKFKAACNALGRKLHQDIWNLLQKDAEPPASFEQCEALLKEAEKFNQAFPAVKPRIPVKELRNRLEKIRQAREEKKQQLEEQLKKTPPPESLPAKIVLLPHYLQIQIRVQLCELPEGCIFIKNGQAVSQNDREIILTYPDAGFFRYKTELDNANDRFKKAGKMSSNPKRVLNQAIAAYNEACDQTNKNLADWLVGKVQIQIPFEDQPWNVQINFEPIKKESAVP